MRYPPVIIQGEAAECGLTCLAMMAGYYGSSQDMVDLRRKTGFSIRGASLKQLMEAADVIKLSARALRAEIEYFDQIRAPVIVHFDFQHFVLLVRVRKSKMLIHDPAIGRLWLTRDQFSKRFTGIALEVAPGDDFKSATPGSRPKFIRAILGRSQWRRALTLIVGLTFGVQILGLLSPLVLQWGIDTGGINTEPKVLLAVLLGFALAMWLNVVLELARGFLIARASALLRFEFSSSILAHLIRLPYAFFQKRQPGDTISRVMSIDSFQAVVATTAVESLVDGPMAMAMLLLTAFYSVKLMMISVVALLLLVICQYVLSRSIAEATLAELMASGSNYSLLIETLQSIQSIRLFAVEDDRISQLNTSLIKGTNAKLYRERLVVNLSAIQRGISATENVSLIGVGIYSVAHGQLSIGMLVAFLSYRGQLSSATMRLMSRLTEIRQATAHLERVSDIANEPADKCFDFPVFRHAEYAGELTVENLGFRFSQSEPFVFRGLSFKLLPGETLAICGPSGRGKSTLLKLILGLYPVTEGRILVDGLELNDTNVRWWRQSIASVLQDDQLFSGSILDNVVLHDPFPDYDRLKEVCSMAELQSDILKMPMGNQTLVGHLGSALSGGQKQRLLLARALYRKSKLLVLDEATSHLDLETEARIAANLRALGMAKIIVAHRPETIRLADKRVEIN